MIILKANFPLSLGFEIKTINTIIIEMKDNIVHTIFSISVLYCSSSILYNIDSSSFASLFSFSIIFNQNSKYLIKIKIK